MKKTVAKYLCIILSVAMLVTALPLTVYAEDNVTEKKVGSADELAAACTEINTNGGKYVINLTGNIIGGHIDIKKSGAVVTVNGNGHAITKNNVVVYVSDGATVNLSGGSSTLTLQGSVEPHTTLKNNDDPGLIYVLPGSTCTMSDNVTLKNHKGNNYLGGGVTVEGGTFVMNGGTIENCGIDGGSVCYGGGVAVFNGGYFEMNGGTISKCYAITDYVEENSLYKNSYSGIGGGVFVTDASVFTMNGGTISNNTATNFGGGVAMTLSDIETQTDPNTGKEIIDPDTGKGYVDLGNPRSKVTINSGTLSRNIAKYGAGIFVSGLIYAFADVFYHKPLVAGDSENPGLYINGGENKTVEISSNKADEMGGGVMINGLKDTRKAQIHNTKIINNTAAKGAGVMNYSYWTQLDIDGCTISGNKATSNGGGIMAEENSDKGYTSIKNTTIKDNTSGNRGAGVYYDIKSEIRVSGADIIQNNKFDGKQNNLNIFSHKKPVTVAGDLTGSQIGLSDPSLWDDGKEDIAADAVSTLRLTDCYKSNNDNLIPDKAFTSDHESWYVDFGDKFDSETTVYRYTAKKYNNSLGLSEGYNINTRDNGDLFIKVPSTTFSGYTENVGSLYKELCDLYGKNDRYTYVRDYELYGYLSDYPGKIYYDSIIKTYVAVFRMKNSSIFVLTSSDSNSFVNYEYDKKLFMASGNVQKFLDGEENVLCLKIYNYYNEANIPGLFNEFTEEELEYDEPLDFGNSDTKTVYKINEYGFATTKYVIEKGSEEKEGSYDYTNEVRLVRKDINYHINNEEIDDNYNNNDIFTSYVRDAIGKDIKVGDTIEKFYTIPEVKATKTNSCPYIFKGWYYDPDNDNDTHPVTFGTDKYSKDIYAHWIKVEDVEQDEKDDNELPPGYNGIYGGFDLAGVQVREGIRDTNFGYEKMPGGLRFVTSLNMDVVNQINAIKPNKNNIEYGYVAATNKGWIDYHSKDANRKLQYVSETANGIDTSSDKAENKNYFGFASNINCTSRRTNSGGIVKEDHRNFDGYLLYTLVITYENVEESAKAKDTNVLARPYIRYWDANGLERVAYSEYRGNSNTLGGCYTCYNAIAGNN